MEASRGPDLAGLATPALYQRNAFRLSGLPVDASARQVRRRAEEVEAALRLGAELTVGDAWIPLTAVDGDAVREALHRLRDPVKRTVDEFFWLWPGLGGDTLAEAEMMWDKHVEAEPPDPTARAIARHNRAVVSHLKVLESPPRWPASTAERWRLAYANWRLVLVDDMCWRYLTDRVATLGDPRLRPGVVERLRRELPDLLLSIHARLTVAAAIDESGVEAPRHGTHASWHLAAMRESRFPAAEVDQALVSATEPHVARLRALSERATSATAVLSESMHDWRVVRLVLGDGHSVAAGIADALASRVRECVVREVNSLSIAVENALPRMREAVQSLDEAHRLATGEHVRATIVRDTCAALANMVVAHCEVATRAGRQFPRHGLERQDELVARTRNLLARLEQLGYDRLSTVRDEVADAASQLVIAYANNTRDATGALRTIRGLRSMATNSLLRGRIDEAIATLDRIVTASRRPAQPRTYGTLPVGQHTRISAPNTDADEFLRKVLESHPEFEGLLSEHPPMPPPRPVPTPASRYRTTPPRREVSRSSPLGRIIRLSLLGVLVGSPVFIGGAALIEGGWSWQAVRDGLGVLVMCVGPVVWELLNLASGMPPEGQQGRPEEDD